MVEAQALRGKRWWSGAGGGVVPHGLNRAGLRDAQAKVEVLETAPLERANVWVPNKLDFLSLEE